MISPLLPLVFVFVVTFAAVSALPPRGDLASFDEPYHCEDKAVHVIPLGPSAFTEQYCSDRLCVTTNSATLKRVETFNCDVHPNLCSQNKEWPRYANGPIVMKGTGVCVPVKSSKITFTCPSGDELILTVNEDSTSSFHYGNIVNRAPSAYYDSSFGKDNCVNLTTKGNSVFSIDHLHIMCYANSPRLCA